MKQPRPSPLRRDVLRLPNLPDSVLINRLVEMGQPRPHATTSMDSPQLRTAAILFYFDVEDARRGDKAAKERVEYVREQWLRLTRAAKAIGEDPDAPRRPMISVPRAIGAMN